MLHLIGKIPQEHFFIAVSGGIDSMVLLSLLQKFPKNKFSVLHFNHGTEHGKLAEQFVINYCQSHHLQLFAGNISRTKEKKESWEEYWRNERYAFFKLFNGKILTAHHLNDAVETWIFTSLRGNGKLIPYQRDNFIRPLLACEKTKILTWGQKNDVPWIEDESNAENEHSRNIIRNELMPTVKKINPGIEKTVKKMILEKWRENNIKVV